MTEALETVQRLWDDVETIRSEDYPTDMAPTPTPLVQPGWFPVETGLYASESGQIPSTLPGGGLMVIGHPGATLRSIRDRPQRLLRSLTPRVGISRTYSGERA
jgi:hypothetical protein